MSLDVYLHEVSARANALESLVWTKIIYCIIYVLPLYASSTTRAAAGRPRDAPEAIRARIRSVTFSTTLCSLVTFVIISNSSLSNNSPLHLMGYWPLGMVEACKSLLLTCLLFSGPLYENLLVEGNWRCWLSLEPLQQLWFDWAVWRNMMAV